VYNIFERGQLRYTVHIGLLLQVQILPVAPSPSRTMSDIYRDSIFWVEVERIKPNPFQPRREFDEAKLHGLAESIRMYGLLQPLTVTRNETTQDNGGIIVEYELVAGERRLRASKIAGLTQVPVIIRSGEDTDQMKLELAIIENLQREDLNPVDRAKAFLRLHKDFNFTHVDIGKKMGKSREYVSNTLRLLALPEAILGYLAEGRISEGHTRPLLMLNDRPAEQSVLAKEILLKKLTVRESEALARRSAQDKVSAKHKINPEILSLERKLTEKLGTRVQIEQREVGGKLVISFFSADDLSALLNTMRLEEDQGTVSHVFNGNPSAPAASLAQKVAMVEQGSIPETVVVEEIIEVDEESAEQPEIIAEVSVVEEARPEIVVNESEETISESVQDSVFQNTEIFQEEDTQPQKHTNTEEQYDHPLMMEDLSRQEKEPEGVLTPSLDRPIPEPYIETTAENIASSIHEPFVPRVAPKVAEEKEEDLDLYSIRNFSI
jgi:ParB family transcriptional regulator, chromosome partitioning protein